MMKLKSIYILLLFLLFTVEKLYSDIVIAKSFDGDSGKTWTWRISEEAYKALPEINWETRPELKLADAVEKARALVAQKNPGKEIIIDRIAIVQPIIVEKRKNKYFYDMSFDVFSPDKTNLLRTEQVVMFLSGEVIEPDEE